MPTASNNNQRTGVIVDAFSSAALLSTLFKKQGWRLIHVRTTKTPVTLWGHYNINRDDFIRDIYEPDTDKLARELAGYQPSFVIAGTEPAVELADLLCERLHLPNGNGTNLSSARRDKYEMVETIRAAGLRATRQIRTADVKEALNFAKSLPKFRVILKPLRSLSTDHVYEATNEVDLRRNFQDIMDSLSIVDEPNTAVCVQEFLVGDEYIVDTVSRDGKTIVTDVWKYTKNPFNGLPLFYDYAEILEPSDPSLDALKDYAVKAIAALGIKWGPTHPEIMLTKDGPVVVEVNARMAGASLPILVTAVQNYGQLELTAQVYSSKGDFERMIAEPPKLLKANLWVMLRSSRTGMVKSVDKFSAIRNLPTFNKLLLYLEPGKPIERTVNMSTSPGAVYLVGDSREAVMKDYAAIRELEAGDLYETEAVEAAGLSPVAL